MQQIYHIVSVAFLTFFVSNVVYAEQIVDSSKTLIKGAPEVGKHVMANVDPSNMILSLLMVLAVIVASALILKRFNFVQQRTEQMNIVASLSLGAKERVVVVQVGEQQMVLGVTQQQITFIDNLAEPLAKPNKNNSPLTSNIFAFLQQNHDKVNSNSANDGNINTDKK